MAAFGGRGARMAFKSVYDGDSVTFLFGKIRILLAGTFNTCLRLFFLNYFLIFLFIRANPVFSNMNGYSVSFESVPKKNKYLRFWEEYILLGLAFSNG